MAARPDERGELHGHVASEAEIAAAANTYASGNGYYLSRRAAEIVAQRLCADPHEQGAEDLLVGQVLRQAGVVLRGERERFRVLARPGEEPGPENNWVYASPAEREAE